jgi:DNA-damage-inducible protein J
MSHRAKIYRGVMAQMGYNIVMDANAVVRSRISVDVKEKATAVLEEMGLTVSDVMRIVLTRVAKENALPFDLKPNKLTRETMRKTALGVDVHQAKDAADLFNKLGI